MLNHFIIRKGQKDDLPEMKKLFVDTIAAICKTDYDEKQIEVWSSTIKSNKRWQNIITKQFVLVAQYKNKIIGFATLDNGNYVDLLYVHKDYQRQGIAQRLLQDLEAEAIRLKQTVLTSEVSKTARSFFKKNNFKILKQQTVNIKGVSFVNYKMSKILANRMTPQT